MEQSSGFLADQGLEVNASTSCDCEMGVSKRLRCRQCMNGCSGKLRMLAFKTDFVAASLTELASESNFCYHHYLHFKWVKTVKLRSLS